MQGVVLITIIESQFTEGSKLLGRSLCLLLIREIVHSSGHLSYERTGNWFKIAAKISTSAVSDARATSEGTQALVRRRRGRKGVKRKVDFHIGNK